MTVQDGGVMVWADGEVLPAERARIAATDHGVTVGDGVFETCKVIDGRPFALSRHLVRLERSAGLLALACPHPDEVRAAVEQLLDVVRPLRLGRLRITVTGGAGPLGSGRGDAPPTLLLAVAPSSLRPDRVGVVTVPGTRNENSLIAGAKSTSYAENVVALNLARQSGADEALLANTQGWLCEGTGSNVVAARGDVLVTPPLSSGCLAGITRELLLEWAADEGLPVIEGDVPMADLDHVQELLLTSSTRDVQPVSSIDGRRLSTSTLGKAAVELFARRAAARIDP